MLPEAQKREIKAKDVKTLLLKVYRRYLKGDISEAQAGKEAYLLNSVLKAIEVTDLEDIVERLEGLTNSK